MKPKLFTDTNDSTRRKVAFTLAEVLITIGIIGVVAAITLPILIQKYQKQVWVNQLKKSVSTWDNGFKMMLADAGTDNLFDTEFWNSLGVGEDYYDYACDGEMDFLASNDEILKKYFNILSFAYVKDGSVKDCSFEMYEYGGSESAYKSLDGKSYPLAAPLARKVQMADGTTVGLQLFSKSSIYQETFPDYAGAVLIDVNGKNKRPNQWGRDAFTFYVNQKGYLVPMLPYEKLKKQPVFCGDFETGDINGATGFGCEARIIHDGWKMNY